MNIFLNSVDISSDVLKSSMNISRNLTDRIASGSFSSKTNKPSPMDEIEIYDGATKIFGGFITEVSCSFDGYSPTYDIEFQDYTIEMNQRYVIDSYEDQTVTQIVEDIVSTYLPVGYTASVSIPTIISRIVFDWKKPSDVFEELANTVSCEWYLDQNKVVRFFERGDNTGQEVSATTDIAFWNTIEYQESIEQLKNKVYIRGGRQTSTDDVVKNLNEQVDGDNDILQTGYTYIYRRDESGNVIEPTLTFNGVEQTIGIENEDSFTAIKAGLETSFGSNKDISYEAVTPGTPGNSVSIEYVVSSPDQTLSVSDAGNKVTVYLESNYNSEPRSTASEIISAVNAGSSLVTAMTVLGQTGEGVPPVMTETSLSGGQDGKDILYNQDEKALNFNTTPDAGDKPVLLTGRIRIPIQIVLEDEDSQDEYSISIEHLINDKSISSRDEAQKKAIVELEKFADALISGKFSTHNSSYIPGQQFRLTVPEFSVDDDFVVRSVSMRSDGGDEMYYTVQYMTKRSKDLVDMLRSLIKTQQAPTDVAELLEKITSIFEQVDWDLTVTQNPLQGDDIQWIAGPYYPTSPTDVKRSPRVGGGAKTL